MKFTKGLIRPHVAGSGGELSLRSLLAVSGAAQDSAPVTAKPANPTSAEPTSDSVTA